MRIAAIDYSVNGPSICIFNTDNDFRFDNCIFHFMTQKKKHEICHKNIYGEHVNRKDYQDKNPVVWYDRVSNWALKVLSMEGVEYVFLEDYAFSKSSRSTTVLAENGGILKIKLHNFGIGFEQVPSTKWKKHSIDMGNAGKDFIFGCLDKDVQKSLIEKFDVKPGNSPISDIADSYFLCKYGVDTIRKKHYN